MHLLRRKAEMHREAVTPQPKARPQPRPSSETTCKTCRLTVHQVIRRRLLRLEASPHPAIAYGDTVILFLIFQEAVADSLYGLQ